MGFIFGFPFEQIFGPLLDHFWAHFKVLFGYQIGPGDAKMTPKRATKSSKTAKRRLIEKFSFFLGKQYFSSSRGLPRKPHRGPRRSSKASKRAAKSKKNCSEKGSRFSVLLCKYGPSFKPILHPKTGSEKPPKMDPKSGPRSGPKLYRNRVLPPMVKGPAAAQRRIPAGDLYVNIYMYI